MPTQLCGTCGTFVPNSRSQCVCGSTSLLGVIKDAIVGLPVGVECSHCGQDSEPLVFRAWVRHTGFIIASREQRSAGYLCRKCAHRQVAGALV